MSTFCINKDCRVILKTSKNVWGDFLKSLYMFFFFKISFSKFLDIVCQKARKLELRKFPRCPWAAFNRHKKGAGWSYPHLEPERVTIGECKLCHHCEEGGSIG